MKKIILVTLFLLGGALSVCISGRVQQTIPMQIIDEGAASSGNTLQSSRRTVSLWPPTRRNRYGLRSKRQPTPSPVIIASM